LAGSHREKESREIKEMKGKMERSKEEEKEKGRGKT
jgi:hypothetical protein